MISPVSVKSAMSLQHDVIKSVKTAQESGLLPEAISIMLEYISVPLILDMLSDIQDMLADPTMTPLAEMTAEDFNEFWSEQRAKVEKGGKE